MKYHGTTSGPTLLIHGGAGAAPSSDAQCQERLATLRGILKRGLLSLTKGATAVDAVQQAVGELEECGLFNAGRGAVKQADGKRKLSAGLMDGTSLRFSGVSLVTTTPFPSKLALALNPERYRTLSGDGADALARRLGLVESQWTANPGSPASDTVGAVARDGFGRLAAATSTGGITDATPGRVSDVSSVAGNYATHNSAVSCTGIGEEIVDHGVAARIDARVETGMSLLASSQMAYELASSHGAQYGWIGLDAKAAWVIFFTTPAMYSGVIAESEPTPRVCCLSLA